MNHSKIDLPEQQVIFVQNGQYRNSEDETDLFDIWNTLCQYRKFILLTTVAVTLVAVIYVFLVPPVYTAEASLLPPTNMDVLQLHIQGVQGVQGVQNFTSDYIFNVFKRNLSSKYLQQQFFDENEIKLTPPRLTVNSSSNKVRVKSIAVSFEFNDAVAVATLLNKYVHFISTITAAQLIDAVNGEIKSQIQLYERLVFAKRMQAAQERKDQIVALEESLSIARKLKLESRVLDSSSAIRTTLIPLYLGGIKELEEQIFVLKNRKSDDPFISGLRGILSDISVLKSAEFDSSAFKVAHIAKQAVPPLSMTKPKRKRIIVFGFVVGLILSVFVVFIGNAIQSNRERRSSTVLED